MRTPLIRLSCLLSLLIASSASAVTMAWTPIGNPGNACDPLVFSGYHSCWGAVSYSYSIGTYELTNAQYVEFLNAVAADDPYELYWNGGSGSITRTGNAGNYSYVALAGRETMPVVNVSYYDAQRFANWLHNGQPNGAEGPGITETGAYTITANAISNRLPIARNAGATYFLPNENEWYKAAFYDPQTHVYYDFQSGSNAPPTCAPPNAVANYANCGNTVGGVTGVGAYTGSPSPYGTFDQAGNVSEWNEVDHSIYGGAYNYAANQLGSSQFDGHYYSSIDPSDWANVGFRLATIIPEPSTGLLVFAGLLGLAGWRRGRD